MSAAPPPARPPEYQAGLAQVQRGDIAGALATFEALHRRLPDDPDTLQAVGFCLRRLGHEDRALDAYRAVLAIDAHHVDAILNMMALLLERGDLDEADALAARGLALAPHQPGVLVNAANVAFCLGRLDEAERLLRHAVEVKPDMQAARKNLGDVLLLKGDLVAGFRAYEARNGMPGQALVLDGNRYGKPAWQGQDLAGKTLLAVTEQGIGDMLQFVRYGALVQAHGGRLTLTCHKPLIRLMRAAPVVDGLVCDGDPPPQFDYHLPLLSLPFAFATTGVTIPANVPYLRALPEWRQAWQSVLGPRTRPRVGIVWGGSAQHKNDRNRSLPVELLAPLLARSGVEFFGIQVETRSADAGFLAANPGFRQLGGMIRDYADTAGLLAELDLVLTVDTSVAHLAGALGRPVWTLLPFVPDWRWQLERSDSPWYPTMRLFRQARRGDWPGVIAAVGAALDAASGQGRP